MLCIEIQLFDSFVLLWSVCCGVLYGCSVRMVSTAQHRASYVVFDCCEWCVALACIAGFDAARSFALVDCCLEFWED